ncbi:segregation and condensation protein A [Macrococcoides caseolyticum]|uniref:segregation and condensation protein A n=1 Tax=Macrococcoides caseolyticum TaxID=69966 RepID=UPI001F2F17BD|nr:segregation/condensation protein A [Macrococcus caseolyticus]MCE4957096.1 segregation/condensation protein A [Macrococcus caseolyticus]
MYEVKLASFEGPLDLLLHLIQKFEIDIYDISMKVLTEQYINYIKNVEDLDINQHSDYLVMASELLRIKSKTLLPDMPSDDNEMIEDPREDLMRQLLEYQNYRLYADILKTKKEAHEKYFIKRGNDLSSFENAKQTPLHIELNDLITAYQKAKQRRKTLSRDAVSVMRDSYSMEEAIDHVRGTLTTKDKVTFDDFVTFAESKTQIVTLFLAILELMKVHEIIVNQESEFGEITIERGIQYAK